MAWVEHSKSTTKSSTKLVWLVALDPLDIRRLIGPGGGVREICEVRRTGIPACHFRQTGMSGLLFFRDFAILCAVKRCGFQWVQVPPGNWSLQPVAVGAAVEVTKLSKPSMTKGR